MEYRFISENEYTRVNANYIKVNFIRDDETAYIIEGEPTQYYRYQCWLDNVSPNFTLRLIGQFSGITDIELLSFIERMTAYRETADTSEIIKKYPGISDEEIEKAMCRAIQRMNIHPMMADILMAVATGVTKRSLIEGGLCTCEDIDKAIFELQDNISYYCYSEYEKKYLLERAEGLNSGQIEFLYTNALFAEKHNIPESYVEGVIEKILTNQTALSEEETAKMRVLLNTNDCSLLTDEDKDFVFDAYRKIEQYYIGEENKYYESIASGLINDGICHNIDLKKAAYANGYDYYKLYSAYIRLGVHPSHHIRTEDRRKKLNDYLDD